MNCDECGLLCLECMHSPAEVFVINLEHLIARTPQHIFDDGIVSVVKSGNHYSKNYSFNITKPEHIQG